MRGFKQNKLARNGVSTPCVAFLCIVSFFCGYLVVKRFQAVFEPFRMEGRSLHFDNHSQESSYKDSNTFSQVNFSNAQPNHSSVEMHLAAAKASSVHEEMSSPTDSKKGVEQQREHLKIFFVMGIITAFSGRKCKESLRESWMPQATLKLEKEKGIIVRFVIGHSASPGGVLDRAIDAEEIKHKLSSTVVAKWDAEFYIKVDDDVHVKLEGFKYHELEFWKFGGEENKYFRHATGQIYALSKDLATYISANKHVHYRYADEDVSLGSWLIGLDVNHVDDRSLCCETSFDYEWKTQPGSPCAASFDWSCSGVCKSVERMKEVHQRCGEGDGATWHT